MVRVKGQGQGVGLRAGGQSLRLRLQDHTMKPNLYAPASCQNPAGSRPQMSSSLNSLNGGI